MTAGEGEGGDEEGAVWIPRVAGWIRARKAGEVGIFVDKREIVGREGGGIDGIQRQLQIHGDKLVTLPTPTVIRDKEDRSQARYVRSLAKGDVIRHK